MTEYSCYTVLLLAVGYSSINSIGDIKTIPVHKALASSSQLFPVHFIWLNPPSAGTHGNSRPRRQDYFSGVECPEGFPYVRIRTRKKEGWVLLPEKTDTAHFVLAAMITVLKGINQLVYFLVELGMFASLGYVGFHSNTHPYGKYAAALGLPLIAIVL